MNRLNIELPTVTETEMSNKDLALAIADGMIVRATRGKYVLYCRQQTTDGGETLIGQATFDGKAKTILGKMLGTTVVIDGTVKKLVWCPTCGRLHWAETDEDKAICKVCLENLYSTDEITGERCLKSEMTEVDGKKVSLETASNSEYVIRLQDTDELHILTKDAKKVYYNLPNTKLWFTNERSFMHYYAGDVHGYHSCRRFTPLHADGETVNDNTLYLGAELEVEYTGDGSVTMGDLIGIFKGCLRGCLADIEHDGSLRHGFEVIFQPMTPKKWYEIKGLVGTAMYLARKYGLKSHDTSSCGLHFHTSKAAYNKTAIDKADAIMAYFRSEMEKLARRTNGSYYQYTRTINVPALNIETTNQFGENSCSNSGRYRAINYTNSKTIEYRIFKGTLNVRTFYASLELVTNIVKLANSDCCELRMEDLLEGRYLPEYAKKRNVNRYARCITILAPQQKKTNSFSTLLNEVRELRMQVSTGGAQ